MEIAELTNALLQQGIKVVPDAETGFKLYIMPDTPGQSTEKAIKLLELLKEQEHQIVPFLNGGGKYKNGGNEMTININVNINASPELMGALQSLVAAVHGVTLEPTISATAEPIAPVSPAPTVPTQTAPATEAQQQPPLSPVTTSAPQQPPTAPVAPPAPPAAAVPTSAQTYTLDQLAVAATQLMDAGHRDKLVNLLTSFGVQALTALPKDQYGNFATQLRALGAKL